MNFSLWLGDASSLWMSLGALIVIAVLVVLMFNAFQSRARRRSPRWQESRAAEQQNEPRPGVSGPQGRSRSAIDERVEPRFVEPHGSTLGAMREPDEDSSRAIAASIDERFPPDIVPDEDVPAGFETGQSHRPESSAVSSDAALQRIAAEQGSGSGELPAGAGHTGAAGATAASRAGVTALRRSQDDGSLPSAADWGVLDDRIDCVAILQMSPAVDCIALRSGAQALARIGSKSVIAEVQLADGGWCDVRAAEGLAARMRLGILLANRQGPLSASEFAEFAEKLRRLAGKLGVPDLRLPETMGVLERARQVDEFCARLDTLIGVNVLSASRIDAPRVAEIAQSLQMIPRGHQRYARTAQSGDVLFTLVQAERPEMLTFVLDVPRAPAAEQPWSRMVEAARRCAELLGAQVVDDAMAPLSDAAAQAVARQLQSHYAQLAGAGLDAGSPAALRVFN